MKTRFKSSALTIIATLLGMLLFAGCNTMRGLGKDTERVGEKIQEKAR